MTIRIEFFGIARQRAGLKRLELDSDKPQATLHDVLRLLGQAAPQLRDSGLLANGELHPTLSANVGGERFVRDPATIIRDGQSLLIMSADAGG
jgi:molybdopterin converting factor small subunit